MSLIVNGSAGKHAMMLARLNIANTPVQPIQWSTGGTSSWPAIEPKPAIPSQMPLIVASAFSFLFATWSLPMSHKMIPITTVAPFSNRLKLVIRPARAAVCWCY